MAVTGAFYPAVDVAAGEKERGTMETLLISPAARSEIVLGKFFTVVTFSISTVLLNLLSMGITGKYLISLARNEALTRMGADSLVVPRALGNDVADSAPAAALCLLQRDQSGVGDVCPQHEGRAVLPHAPASW